MPTSDGSDSSIPADKKPLLELIDQEVERQISSHSRSASTIDTHAALLVSVAIIFVALPKGDDPIGCAYVLAVIFALIGASSGATALFVKRYGKEINLKALEGHIWNFEQLEALQAITAAKQRNLYDDRKRLEHRRRIIAFGFSSLVLSLLATVIHVLFGV